VEISIGLPDHVPGLDPAVLVEWARRAEARGFAAVVATERLAWSTPEPLTVLAAVAGATARIGIVAGVLLAPLRPNHALLAKSVATLDAIAGRGRLRIGMAPGLRKDDFDAAGLDFHTRGRQLDVLVGTLREIWAGESGIGPRPATPGGPPLLFGGASDHTARRVVASGDGWIASGIDVARFETFAKRLRTEWSAAGRPGTPQLVDTVNVVLGPGAADRLAESINSYYAFLPPDFRGFLLAAGLTTAEQVEESVAAHLRAGCDELVLVGNSADPAQVDLLADAAGLRPA